MSVRLRRLVIRWTVVPLLLLVGLVAPPFMVTMLLLASANVGTPQPAARSTGHDAMWLGHAWVDGRRAQSDVDSLAAHLRRTGIRDLMVHAGPFDSDGNLDLALRPRARWFTAAMHAVLPGVRLQAWLGAHPTKEELHLWEPATRGRIVHAIAGVLADGFDGIHYDFEPIGDGDENLLAILRESRPTIRAHDAMLSVSAIHIEPWSGAAVLLSHLPAALSIWSTDYLHQVAILVDQVALMSYDTGLPSEPTYTGYVRKSTVLALDSVPRSVGLLIGVPVYPAAGIYHHASENIGAAARGVRLALGDAPAPVDREFGIALYVDFTVTPDDWAVYDREWMSTLDC